MPEELREISMTEITFLVNIPEVFKKDATASFEDVGHSKDAREMTKDYLTGTLKGDAATTPSVKAAAAGDGRGSSLCAKWKEIISSPTWSNFHIPTTIGIIVFFSLQGDHEGLGLIGLVLLPLSSSWKVTMP
ncbi:unnamed protein product [Heligmosomoides polygyrus]|uniref:Cytochrome b5 heme-binding domain-containing protein n=1 Tax=Heligmosomoides polygyrus TaxID=6339 RepID=A0A183FV22_HELPZ|nr:unnamed protein product [Heligmosomoides polygyrus]